jgi:hypothetical protein
MSGKYRDLFDLVGLFDQADASDYRVNTVTEEVHAMNEAETRAELIDPATAVPDSFSTSPQSRFHPNQTLKRNLRITPTLG